MTADDAAKNGIAGRGPSGARSSRPRQRAGATIYAPQFIGRTRELAALAAEMDRARAGEFRVALVSGTAGVGKTRLAAEISDRNAQGAVALSARAYRWGEATSYGVWIEALDRHLRTLPAEEIRRLCGGSIATLASILASVGSVAGVPDREPGRGRILEALVEFFDRASRERPVFVLLDDMHLADASSWEALRYLARRLPAAPIGIVATRACRRAARESDRGGGPLGTDGGRSPDALDARAAPVSRDGRAGPRGAPDGARGELGRTRSARSLAPGTRPSVIRSSSSGFSERCWKRKRTSRILVSFGFPKRCAIASIWICRFSMLATSVSSRRSPWSTAASILSS